MAKSQLWRVTKPLTYTPCCENKESSICKHKKWVISLKFRPYSFICIEIYSFKQKKYIACKRYILGEAVSRNGKFGKV